MSLITLQRQDGAIAKLSGRLERATQDFEERAVEQEERVQQRLRSQDAIVANLVAHMQAEREQSKKHQEQQLWHAQSLLTAQAAVAQSLPMLTTTWRPWLFF